jgi:hypothetical protein
MKTVWMHLGVTTTTVWLQLGVTTTTLPHASFQTRRRRPEQECGDQLVRRLDSDGAATCMNDKIKLC